MTYDQNRSLGTYHFPHTKPYFLDISFSFSVAWACAYAKVSLGTQVVQQIVDLLSDFLLTLRTRFLACTRGNRRIILMEYQMGNSARVTRVTLISSILSVTCCTLDNLSLIWCDAGEALTKCRSFHDSCCFILFR